MLHGVLTLPLTAKLKLKTRGVLYPAHPGGCDESLSVQNAITKLELIVRVVKVNVTIR